LCEFAEAHDLQPDSSSLRCPAMCCCAAALRRDQQAHVGTDILNEIEECANIGDVDGLGPPFAVNDRDRVGCGEKASSDKDVDLTGGSAPPAWKLDVALDGSFGAGQKGEDVCHAALVLGVQGLRGCHVRSVDDPPNAAGHLTVR
jgi:hypothetical protein